MKARKYNSFLQLKKLISGEITTEDFEQANVEMPLFRTFAVSKDGTELKNIDTGKVYSKKEYERQKNKEVQISFDEFTY